MPMKSKPDCRIVIRHASFDAARMLAARWKREISLEYLTEEKFVPLSTTDEYFQVPDYGETYPFSVRGQTILLDSCSLAAALAELPEQTQEEIFLYYFHVGLSNICYTPINKFPQNSLW